MPFSNLLDALRNAIRTGGDTEAILLQMAGQDPRAAQAMQMLRGKSPQQVQKMVENMCRERGTTPAELAQNMGIPFPGGR